MVAKERTSPGLVEGHPRFCRACGHDLLGLTGEQCPRCGRVVRPRVSRHAPPNAASGKWLVAGLLAVGLVLAVVGVKYRKVEPRRDPPSTNTTTAPAAQAAPARPDGPDGH
jgi:hypothetical protein